MKFSQKANISMKKSKLVHWLRENQMINLVKKYNSYLDINDHHLDHLKLLLDF